MVGVMWHILEFYTSWNISGTTTTKDFKFCTHIGDCWPHEVSALWCLTIPKWAWSGSRDPFLHFGAKAIHLEQTKLDISNLVCTLNVKSTSITHAKVLQYGGAFRVMWPLKILRNNCTIKWYNGRLMRNQMCPIEWHQYQWPWVTLNVTVAALNLSNYYTSMYVTHINHNVCIHEWESICGV